MRTYSDLPPGCTPADIERQCEEDPEVSQAHAMGWTSAEINRPRTDNPFPDIHNPYAESLHDVWNEGWRDFVDSDKPILPPFNSQHQIKIKQGAGFYGNCVVTVVEVWENGALVVKDKGPVWFVSEEDIENEWRRTPCIRQLEKENAELTGRLAEALSVIGAVSKHYDMDTWEWWNNE